jgi:hypothetical protein
MTDVVGSDLTQGREVKWYFAGTEAGSETKTATAGDASDGYFALAADAEYGSVVVYNDTDSTIVSSVTECSDTAGATPCTDGTAVKSVDMSITSGKVYLLKYCAITAVLVHVGTSRDVKFSAKADEKKVSIHGQANKVVSVGATEYSGSLEEFHYNQSLIAVAYGHQMTASPTTGKEKHTTAFRGMQKIGALVGKRYNAAGTVTRKYFLMGTQFTGIDDTFPTDDFYSRTLSFTADYKTETDLS